MLTAALAGGPVHHENDRVIRVSGEGVATPEPDMATIHSGVVTRADSATEAIASNNKAMNDVLSALKQHNIAEDDVQTTSFNVRPVHKRGNDGRTLPEIAAYEVTNQVRVKVRNLDNLGTILDAVVQTGSNRVSGIEFDVSNSSAVLDQARKEAVANAKHRAAVLAKEAGVRVGRVISIQEQSQNRPQPRFYARAADQSESVPIARGREEFRVTVQVVFEIAEQQ